MRHEEFVSSVRQRITQLQSRAKMEWYSQETLEHAIDTLKQTLLEYISNRPEFKSEVTEYIREVEQLQ